MGYVLLASSFGNLFRQLSIFGSVLRCFNCRVWRLYSGAFDSQRAPSAVSHVVLDLNKPSRKGLSGARNEASSFATSTRCTWGDGLAADHEHSIGNVLQALAFHPHHAGGHYWTGCAAHGLAQLDLQNSFFISIFSFILHLFMHFFVIA